MVCVIWLQLGSNSEATVSDVVRGVDRPSYKKNLNMLSAFVHVGGDTIRTLSVIIGATISTTAHIDTDKWIVLMVIPLIRDIIIAATTIGYDTT